MIKKILITTLITTTFTFSSELYAVTKHIDTGISNTLKMNTLIGKKMIAHTSVYFQDGEMTEESQEKLKSFLSHVKASSKVTVVGHSSESIDVDHSIKLSGWAEFWHNLGSDGMTSVSTVNENIGAVYTYLQENNIPASNIYNENRMDADPVSTEATPEGKALNNRVDVALY